MRNFIKRVFDLCLAGCGLVISLPLWLIFALVIKLSDKGPVFYIQERVGRGGTIFKVMKFRTMGANTKTVLPVMQLLRKSALDELPQLINIVKGEMSFVGPRPLIKEEIDAIKDEKHFNNRLAVRPGLTGIAQLLLPKTATVKEKLLFDTWYIKNYDIMLDIKVILLSYAITFLGRWEIESDKLKALESLKKTVEREIER